MLIEITEDCLLSLPTEKYSLMHVLNSYCNGNHVVMFEKRCIYKELKKIYENDEMMLKIIQNILGMHNENKNLQKLTKTVLKVMSKDSEFKKYNESSKLYFEVPVNYFNGIVKECLFITENDNDADNYDLLAKRAQKEKFINIPDVVKFNSMEMHGGGDTTYTVFNRYIKKKNTIVLCVCDSDKTSIHSDIGQTPSKVLKSALKANCDHISNVHILDVREKENLIPPKYYRYHPSYNDNKVLESLEDEHELFRYLKISDSNTHLDEETLRKYDIKTNKGYGITKKGFGNWLEYFFLNETPRGIVDNSGKCIELQGFSFFDGLPSYLKEEHLVLIQHYFDWTCTYGRMRVSY